MTSLTMRAAVIPAYGGANVFTLKEMPRPTCAPAGVLIKNAAVAINPIDWKIRQGALRYLIPLKFPAILGFDICVEILEVGSQVTSFKRGDWVIARSQYKDGRGYADYIALDEKYLVSKPKHLSATEAASLPLAAVTALQALRDIGRIAAEKEVMVIGASGGVGLFAVQLAKIFGAKVTAVCSGENVAMVEKLGADFIIDYKTTSVFAHRKKYDLVFDAVSKHNYLEIKNILSRRGIYVATLPSLQSTLGLLMNIFYTSKCYVVMNKNNAQDLRYIAQLVESHKLQTVIDSVYPLAEVAKAHQRSESEHAHGKIVLDLAG